MTAHQTARVQIIARTTQDGYDWPNPHPTPPAGQPMAPYFRAQLLEDSYVQLADVPVWREPLSPSELTAVYREGLSVFLAKSACTTCGGTGVRRVPPKMGDMPGLQGRLVHCPACGPK